MKIQLLLATNDQDYAEYLYAMLAKHHADMFELSLCTHTANLSAMLEKRRYDVCLLEAQADEPYDLTRVQLVLLLQGAQSSIPEALSAYARIRKYQRISCIASTILERYAQVAKARSVLDDGPRARITAVWSPAGGVGKTSVALAYAAQQASRGQQTAYLNLEHFCSLSAFLSDSGKSISSVFERADEDPALQMRSIRQTDAASGLFYYGAPENYDDMNILGAKEVMQILEAAATGVTELVVDLPATCDDRIQAVLTAADRILLVTDRSAAAQKKIALFMAQHNIYSALKHKVTPVANKSTPSAAVHSTDEIVLPFIQSADPAQVFRALSASSFQPS